MDVEAFTGQLQRKLVEGEIHHSNPGRSRPPGLTIKRKLDANSGQACP